MILSFLIFSFFSPNKTPKISSTDWPTEYSVRHGPGDRDSIPGRVIPKTQKILLDAALLNTRHYKLKNKGKVDQSREWSSAPLHLGVVAIEKRAFGSPTTMVANFTFLFIYCPPQTDCFVVSQLFSVARHARFPKLESKPS